MKIKLELEITDCRECPLHQADPKRFSLEWGCVYDGREDRYSHQILMHKERELLLPCQWRKCPLEAKE